MGLAIGQTVAAWRMAGPGQRAPGKLRRPPPPAVCFPPALFCLHTPCIRAPPGPDTDPIFLTVPNRCTFAPPHSTHNRHRRLDIIAANTCNMIKGQKRCPLSARLHICDAKIRNRLNSCFLRQPRRITNLHRNPLRRVVINCLAVKPDHLDIARNLDLIGRVRRDLGRFAEAAVLPDEALQMRTPPRGGATGPRGLGPGGCATR